MVAGILAQLHHVFLLFTLLFSCYVLTSSQSLMSSDNSACRLQGRVKTSTAVTGRIRNTSSSLSFDFVMKILYTKETSASLNYHTHIAFVSAQSTKRNHLITRQRTVENDGANKSWLGFEQTVKYGLPFSREISYRNPVEAYWFTKWETGKQ